MFEQLQKINESGLLLLNSFSSNETIANLVGILADAPIFFLPIFLVLTWIYYASKKDNEGKNKLLFIFYSAVIGIIIAIIIQQIFHFDRPENYIHGTGKLLLKHVPDASFPSDHATVAFAFLTALFLAGYKKLFWILLPFMLGMSISRIIAGVHWPLDILVGLIIGIFSAIITFKYIKNLKYTKKINNFLIKIASYIKL